MDRLEHIEKYINYVFNDNYSSFNLEYEVVGVSKDFLQCKVTIINTFNTNKKTDFYIRFDDNNFFIQDERNEWKLLSVVSSFDNVLFKILFFKSFFNEE